ncbi:MAG: ArnT family glycosyltransferase [Dehalococcoidia bacterium]
MRELVTYLLKFLYRKYLTDPGRGSRRLPKEAVCGGPEELAEALLPIIAKVLPSTLAETKRQRTPPVAPALLALAILIGVVLRFADLHGVPPALNQDEAVNGYDAYSLFLTGRDHLGHPFSFAGLESFGDWVTPLLTFLTVPAVGLFGLQTEVLRSVSALVGVLLIPIMYLLAVELFGRRSIGLVAAFAIALDPWHVHLSRWAISPSVMPTMVALTMLAIVWTAHRRSSRGIVTVAVAAGLTIASYPTMKFYVPLLGLAGLAAYWRDLRHIKIEAMLYAAIIFIVIAAPALYLSTVDPGGRARFDQVSIFHLPNLGFSLLKNQYQAYFSPSFLFLSGDGDPMHSPPGFGVALLTSFPFLIVGLFWLLKSLVRPGKPIERQSSLFLFLALLLYPLPGSLTLPSPHGLRAAHVIPLLDLTTAIGIVIGLFAFLARPSADRRIAVPQAILAGGFLLVFAAIPTDLYQHFDNYFNHYPKEVAPSFQFGLQQALSYAHLHEREYDQIWVVDTNEPYIYVLFFNQWLPSEVHDKLQVSRNPPGFNQVYAFGKYHFLFLPSSINKNQLRILYTVNYPSGGVAYQVRGGVAGQGGRVLVVSRS